MAMFMKDQTYTFADEKEPMVVIFPSSPFDKDKKVAISVKPGSALKAKLDAISAANPDRAPIVNDYDQIRLSILDIDQCKFFDCPSGQEFTLGTLPRNLAIQAGDQVFAAITPFAYKGNKGNKPGWSLQCWSLWRVGHQDLEAFVAAPPQEFKIDSFKSLPSF